MADPATLPDRPLFVFGTLVDADVRAAVLGTASTAPAPRVEPAALPDHAARAVAGRDYPVAVPASGERAPGLLLHGLDAAAHARLAWFEGAAYALAPCRVHAGGTRVDAAMFVAAHPLPVDGPWSLDDWRRAAKPAFLVLARAWMAELGADAPLADDVVWGRGPGNDGPYGNVPQGGVPREDVLREEVPDEDVPDGKVPDGGRDFTKSTAG